MGLFQRRPPSPPPSPGEYLGCGARAGVCDTLSSPNASPRQLERKIGQLQDLKNSAQEVSSDDTLQMFHESILQSSHSLEEPHATLKRATDSSRLQCLSEDVAMLCCMNAQI
uniref:Uncharacterized protein n=2 Tax=Oryza TaxID=4527 RepID=A0A0E0IZI3_ORYNI